MELEPQYHQPTIHFKQIGEISNMANLLPLECVKTTLLGINSIVVITHKTGLYLNYTIRPIIHIKSTFRRLTLIELLNLHTVRWQVYFHLAHALIYQVRRAIILGLRFRLLIPKLELI